MKYRAVRGTKDILPEESGIWQKTVLKARETFGLYGYLEISTPIIEETELFTRGLGEASEVVMKEMYSFKDKKGRDISLRPEGTAGVIRAYLENNLDKIYETAKLYYIGPMFRYDNPQAGRYRQHWQIGCEAIGSANPALDAEVISLVFNIFSSIGIADMELQINSIGCPECRKKYTEDIKKALILSEQSLCEDCKNKLKRNPMRITAMRTWK